MKKPDRFPFEYSAAGLVFRVHGASQTAVLKNGDTAEYESSLLSYYVSGRRVQKRRNRWAGIDRLIEDAVLAERQKDPERLELTGRDRRICLAAAEASRRRSGRRTRRRGTMRLPPRPCPPWDGCATGSPGAGRRPQGTEGAFGFRSRWILQTPCGGRCQAWDGAGNSGGVAQGEEGGRGW